MERGVGRFNNINFSRYYIINSDSDGRGHICFVLLSLESCEMRRVYDSAKLLMPVTGGIECIMADSGLSYSVRRMVQVCRHTQCEAGYIGIRSVNVDPDV